MVKVLAARYSDRRILAIDADPAVGLSTALGVEVHGTIDAIRKAVVAAVEEGDTRSALELLAESEYRIYDAMTECDGFAFIAVGRPESVLGLPFLSRIERSTILRSRTHLAGQSRLRSP